MTLVQINFSEICKKTFNGVNVMGLSMAIELKRKQMVILASKHGLTSHATVKCSQELDELIHLAQLDRIRSKY